MNTLLIALCASCILTFLLIRYQNLHGHMSGDHDLSGPQKIHTKSVPRIGGVSIAFGALLGSLYIAFKDQAFHPIALILLACLPVFVLDLRKIFLKILGFKSVSLLLPPGHFLRSFWFRWRLLRLILRSSIGYWALP